MCGAARCPKQTFHVPGGPIFRTVGHASTCGDPEAVSLTPATFVHGRGGLGPLCLVNVAQILVSLVKKRFRLTRKAKNIGHAFTLPSGQGTGAALAICGLRNNGDVRQVLNLSQGWCRPMEEGGAPYPVVVPLAESERTSARRALATVPSRPAHCVHISTTVPRAVRHGDRTNQPAFRSLLAKLPLFRQASLH
jgi:hypothetical protein